MWNEILALVVLLALVYSGIVLLPGAPKLIDAVCDRIRHGVQPVVDDLDELDDEEAAPATTRAAATKPTPATTKTRAA
ncbi:hypothetical protein AB0A63_13800 [Lentzea sp. NPDC042327]|uniref:hypothetical protein n=1 Tax=Lentzea sp. NPDC042327 TaxID=3154801 RepID=UPI0033D169BB